MLKVRDCLKEARDGTLTLEFQVLFSEWSKSKLENCFAVSSLLFLREKFIKSDRMKVYFNLDRP